MTLVASACACVAAPSAFGVTVSKTGAVISVTGGAEINEIIPAEDGTYVKFEDGAGVTAGSGCAALSSTAVRCAKAGISAISVQLGGGDDVMSQYPAVANERVALPMTVHGGDGDDTLVGARGNDSIDGGAGDDTLAHACSPVDSNDLSCDMFPDSDVFAGGAGIDTVSYFYYVSTPAGYPVNASIDGVANDGPPGVHDNVGLDVENLQATTLMTATFTGSGGPNRLEGGNAQSVLHGGGGADHLAFGGVLNGGAGEDEIHFAAIRGDGGDGDDRLFAGEFSGGGEYVGDLLGGPGDDRFIGPGPRAGQTEDGGVGTDVLDATGSALGVAVSLDGLANDGTGNGGLGNVIGIENMIGSEGDDRFEGDAADNVFDGRGGGDFFSGGAGVDTIDYSSRVAGVTVSEDGVANDGNALDLASWDNIAPDVERILGTGSADRLTGGVGENDLVGGAGDDTLDGGLGDDLLQGGSGANTVSYAGRAQGVSVAFDGIANDGGDGEYDDLGSPEQFDNIIGGNGDDLLVGGAQANIIAGSGGDDLLLGAAGADALHGGAGDADIVSYEDRDAAVNAALNNQPTAGNAADGPVGARDTIGGDVEGLFGGAGNDILSGNGASNLLSGGPGADVLSGKEGDDAADYSERTSGVTVAPDGTSTSGNADDGPEGSRDRVLSDIEVLFGGAGADTLLGNQAENLLDGQAGNDALYSNDATPDVDWCGAGTDIADIDVSDETQDCEQLTGLIGLPGPATPSPPTGPPSPPTGPPSATTKPTAPKLTLALARGQNLKAVRSQGLRLVVRCTSSCHLDARLAIDRGTAKKLRLPSRRSRVVGRAKAALTTTHARQFTIKLTAQARRRLAALQALRANLTITMTSDRTSQITRRQVVVTRKRATLRPSRSERADLAFLRADWQKARRSLAASRQAQREPAP